MSHLGADSWLWSEVNIYNVVHDPFVPIKPISVSASHS